MLRRRAFFLISLLFISFFSISKSKAEDAIYIGIPPFAQSYVTDPLRTEIQRVADYVFNLKEYDIVANQPTYQKRKDFLLFVFNKSGYYIADQTTRCDFLRNVNQTLVSRSELDYARVTLYLSRAQNLNCFGENSSNYGLRYENSQQVQVEDTTKQVNDLAAGLLREQAYNHISPNSAENAFLKKLENDQYFNKSAEARHSYLVQIGNNADAQRLLAFELQDQIVVCLAWANLYTWKIFDGSKYISYQLPENYVNLTIQKLNEQGYFQKKKKDRLLILDSFKTGGYAKAMQIVADFEANHLGFLSEILSIYETATQTGIEPYHGGNIWKEIFTRSCLQSKEKILFQSPSECFTTKSNWSQDDKSYVKNQKLLPSQDLFNINSAEFTDQERLFLESVFCSENLLDFYNEKIKEYSKNLTKQEKEAILYVGLVSTDLWFQAAADFIDAKGIKPDKNSISYDPNDLIFLSNLRNREDPYWIKDNFLKKEVWLSHPKTATRLNFLYTYYGFNRDSKTFSASEVKLLSDAWYYYKFAQIRPSKIDNSPTLDSYQQSNLKELLGIFEQEFESQRQKVLNDSQVEIFGMEIDYAPVLLLNFQAMPALEFEHFVLYRSQFFAKTILSWFKIQEPSLFMVKALQTLHRVAMFWTYTDEGTYCQTTIQALGKTANGSGEATK